MKRHFVSIKPEDVGRLQHEAAVAADTARKAFESVKDTADVDLYYERLEDWEDAQVEMMHLNNISPERLLYEKNRATKNVKTTRASFKSALRENDDVKDIIVYFNAWLKALLYAKEFGIGIESDVEKCFSSAATFLDLVLRKAQDPDSSIAMHEWQELYWRVMKTFTRLGIEGSRFDLAVLWMSKRIGGTHRH